MHSSFEMTGDRRHGTALVNGGPARPRRRAVRGAVRGRGSNVRSAARVAAVGFLTCLLFAVLATHAVPVQAVGPDAVPRAVRAARVRYRAAADRVARLRAQQSTLEQRIAAFKKSGQQPQALDRLLKRSVDAEATFATARNELAQAEAIFGEALKAAVRAIDTRIRKWVPSLRRGPLSDRRHAATQINALRTMRQRLRTESADLSRARRREKAWAKYRVRFDVRDGPSELSEKADFVEDTRDKVMKKRRALIALLDEAKRDRQIAQAAQDFRTDITLFDEETRQGRVLRRSSSSTPLAAEGGERSPPQSGDAPFDDFSPEQLSDNPAAPRSQVDAGGLRDINPDVLLNLRVEDLAAGALDVATLQEYISDLKALERFLSGQADTLRKRADTLDADEARDLNR